MMIIKNRLEEIGWQVTKDISVFRRVIFFLLISSLALSSCINKFKCDASNQVRLGEIDYSTAFKQWETEQSNEELKFINDNETIILKRQAGINTVTYKRLNEYLVCKSINIKPYSAYAYYEYKDLTSHFGNDAMSVIIEPDISKEEGNRAESIYVTFYQAGTSNSLKGRIPVANVNEEEASAPFGLLFTFHNQITLEDKKYIGIWEYKEGNTAVFYHKTKGIVALEMGQSVFHRIN